MGLSLGSILGAGGAVLGGPWGLAAGAVGGLLDANNAANGQKKAVNKATAAAEADRKLLMDQYNSYDPIKDADVSVARASEVAGKTLENSLRSLRSSVMSGGGQPGMSSEWAVDTNNATNRVMDPLKQFTADAYSNAKLKKMQALQMALGAPTGGLGDAYLKHAGSIQIPDTTGSQAMLTQALRDIMKPKGSSKTGAEKGGPVSIAPPGAIETSTPDGPRVTTRSLMPGDQMPMPEMDPQMMSMIVRRILGMVGANR